MREENVPFSTLTTFKTGGPARFLFLVSNEAELKEAVLFAKEQSLPAIPIGAGSNILASDSGVTAVCIKNISARTEIEVQDNSVRLTVDAGRDWDSLVQETVESGWWGFENLSHIPGTVGASVVQNIGAYGAAISTTVIQVRAFDTITGTSRIFSNAECLFGYRSSIFKKEVDRYIVLSATFSLSLAPKPILSYTDLEKRFSGAHAPELRDIRHAIIAIRKEKFPPLDVFGTAGSFFLNPIVYTEDEKKNISIQFPDMPLFLLPEGGVKIPLAWLFDHALSLKGTRVGGAFVWDKQPLVIATEKGATTTDIRNLAESIQAKTKEILGIKIFPEVRAL